MLFLPVRIASPWTNNIGEMMRKYFGLSMVVALSLLFGCRAELRSLDKATPVVPSQSCSLPCWNQIIPGQTEYVEALEIINNLPFITEYCIEENANKIEINWIDSRFEKMISCGEVVIENNLVKYTYIHDSQPKNTVGDIISEFGLPERVFAERIGVEEFYIGVRMYYPEQGLEIVAMGLPNSDGKYCLREESLVNDFKLFDTSTLDEYINTFSNDNGRRDYLRAKLLSWPGFGCEGFN
jgi:hypothetical protein